MTSCMGFVTYIQTSDKSKFSCSIVGALDKSLKVNSLNFINSSGDSIHYLPHKIVRKVKHDDIRVASNTWCQVHSKCSINVSWYC